MKKHSRIISILLTLMMVVTSFSIVFAVDEPAEAPKANEPTVGTEEASSGVAQETGEDLTGDTTDEGNNSVINDLVDGLERPSVTVIINYVDNFDKQIKPSFTQEITLEKNSEGVYEGHYSVESPKIAGYAADNKVVEGTVNNDSESPTVITVKYTPVPADPVTNLRLHPAYKSIILTWDKVEDAKEYVVQRAPEGGNYVDIATVQNTGGDQIVYTDGNAYGVDSSKHTATRYYYKVFSVSVTDIRSPKPATASNTCVRPMYERIVFDDPCWLTSHDGKNKEMYFGYGTEVIAMGFNGGKYEFWYKGYYFTASVIRFTNCRADYQPNSVANGRATSYSGIWARKTYASAADVGNNDNYRGIKFYDRISAENFVNGSGQSSRTGYLVWVSTYTQHLYVFQGSKGKWKLLWDWECSTGAPWSPTPTGFGKEIIGHEKADPDISYWCNFQTLNSIHGQRSSYTFGSPQSNGCVRNYDENAWNVYTYCPLHTAVIIY